MEPPVLSNCLSTEISPYLLDHCKNPVHWQTWNDNTLQIANRLQKPILLSVGYSACHWCHVMAKESFEDIETANLMNDLFINIKVDKEERPDVDAIYQGALRALGEQPGWPLTMILTPVIEPYAGGTYFPPEPIHGLPSFKQFLKTSASIFYETPEEAKSKGAGLMSEILKKKSTGLTLEVSNELKLYVANGTLDNFDSIYGGFGDQAKFPQTGLLELLWQAFLRTSHISFKSAVTETLKSICNGGINDHIGGGFFRYTVDDRWLLPHFEKMLYDNALLLSILSLVWKEVRDPLFSRCIVATSTWLLREMRLPNGMFASSLAADSEGYNDTDSGEGVFYIWKENEIDQYLGKTASFFKKNYDITPDGNWEGMNILNRIECPFKEDGPTEQQLDEAITILFNARARRPSPRRDEKVLTDWNGLTIKGLADAGAALGRQDWISCAKETYNAVSGFASGEDDLLYHSCFSGKKHGLGMLDDYASMSQAALKLYELTGQIAYLNDAKRWVERLNQTHWDSKQGAYLLVGLDSDSSTGEYMTARESSTPSGNGMMVGVLSRLHSLTNNHHFLEHARSIISAFVEEIPGHYLAMPALINNAELLDCITQIIIVGEPKSEDTVSLLEIAHSAPRTNLIILSISPNQSNNLPDAHPAIGKTMIHGKATAFICRNKTCQAPITDSMILSHELENL